MLSDKVSLIIFIKSLWNVICKIVSNHQIKLFILINSYYTTVYMYVCSNNLWILYQFHPQIVHNIWISVYNEISSYNNTWIYIIVPPPNIVQHYYYYTYHWHLYILHRIINIKLNLSTSVVSCQFVVV